MKAYLFPGQASQFVGMGKDLYQNYPLAKSLMESANDILGFRITDLMFEGTDEDLKETKVTQPSVFLYSVIKTKIAGAQFDPSMVAGHSLGEFSALTAANALSFEDGLSLVIKRAQAMQMACEMTPSTMAAVLGLSDEIVEGICNSVEGTVVAANFNCPGQVVISGSLSAVDFACEKLSEVGARKVIKLSVGGAFHSPLMSPAKSGLREAIEATNFKYPDCPVYQNVDGNPQTDPLIIKENLIDQLTSPVRWTITMKHMIADGAVEFVEVGGKVLSGLVKKVDRNLTTSQL